MITYFQQGEKNNHILQTTNRLALFVLAF